MNPSTHAGEDAAELALLTDFHDVEALAEGLRDRIGQDQLILYGPSAPPEGAQVVFSIALEDGTTALRGGGLVTAAVDGGDERDPEARFDIFLEQLQLDAPAQQTLGRMLEALQGGVVVEDPAEEGLAPEDQVAVELQPAPVNSEPWLEVEEEHTAMVEQASFQAASLDATRLPSARPWSAVRSEPAPAEELPPDENQRLRRLQPFEYVEPQVLAPAWESIVPPVDAAATLTLTRPSRHVDWSAPEAPDREPRPSSGAFAYAAGSLPVPAAAPRPDQAPDKRLLHGAPTATHGPERHEFEQDVQLQSLDMQTLDLVEDEAAGG